MEIIKYNFRIERKRRNITKPSAASGIGLKVKLKPIIFSTIFSPHLNAIVLKW